MTIIRDDSGVELNTERLVVRVGHHPENGQLLVKRDGGKLTPATEPERVLALNNLYHFREIVHQIRQIGR